MKTLRKNLLVALVVAASALTGLAQAQVDPAVRSVAAVLQGVAVGLRGRAAEPGGRRRPALGDPVSRSFVSYPSRSVAKRSPLWIDSTMIAALRWRNIGPANMSGRIADIEGIPSPSRTFFVAAAGGGTDVRGRGRLESLVDGRVVHPQLVRCYNMRSSLQHRRSGPRGWAGFAA